ncbi:AMP-binding protein [Amycolatopsis sp. NPDC004079]|uniref:AMP-binding protein n=1 Tax=Amycolatopsis sp. NPDC004079 TaxID=3154549 RepID=UPI0033BF390C
MTTAATLLRRFLSRPGRDLAVLDRRGGAWSFDDVLGHAADLAGRIRSRGTVRGRVVVLRTGPDVLFSVADLAVLLAGGVPAVLPDLAPAQMRAVWAATDPAAVVDTLAEPDAALADLAVEHATPLHRVGVGEFPRGTPDGRRASALRQAGERDARAAAVVFTSGTTGSPRALVLDDAALVRGVDAWTGHWRGRPARTVSYLPVSHVAQRIMGHTLMCLYGTTIVASSPARLAADVAAHRPDTLLGVPHLWADLAARAAGDGDDGRALRDALAAVATAVNGAAALDPAVAGQLRRSAGLRVASAYGATETTVPAFHQPDATRPGLGAPVEVEHRVAADGELLLRGRNLATGSVRRWPELDPIADDEGWWHTGDLVEAADGPRSGRGAALRLRGRRGAAFKTARGDMISPEPAEAHLLAQPDVAAACLVGHGRPSAVALVSAPASASWRPGEVAAREQRLLVGAEAARHAGQLPWSDLSAVRIVPDSWTELGLLTSTGKPRRRAIADHYRPLLDLLPEADRAHA